MYNTDASLLSVAQKTPYKWTAPNSAIGWHQSGWRPPMPRAVAAILTTCFEAVKCLRHRGLPGARVCSVGAGGLNQKITGRWTPPFISHSKARFGHQSWPCRLAFENAPPNRTRFKYPRRFLQSSVQSAPTLFQLNCLVAALASIAFHTRSVAQRRKARPVCLEGGWTTRNARG